MTRQHNGCGRPMVPLELVELITLDMGNLPVINPIYWVDSPK